MLTLFREDAAHSFSDLWYRVGATRPALATHAVVTRQGRDDRVSYVVEDPAAGQFYRLTEAAYYFLGMLDGRRSVDDAWQACNVQLGDDAPTQRECVDLLAKLQLFGLLAGDQPLSPDMVERRRREAARKRRRKRLGMGMSLTIPVVNPEPFLVRAEYLLRPIFSRWGLVAYLAVLTMGLYALATHWRDLGTQLNQVIAPSNLWLLGLVFVLLRAWHELGHAAAVKALGGRCTEIGLMLIAFVFPFPYCDASDSWRFPRARDRIIVASGGMLFETFVAAIAAVVWAATPEPGPVRTVCYSVMLLSGLTTILFNINPLLRYDGYYILADMAGIPNMWQRSRDLLTFLTERLAFGVRDTKAPPVRSRTEFSLLLAYGLASTPYRLFVMVAIVSILLSRDEYLGLGVLVGAVALVMWVLYPIGKGAAHLILSPKLTGRRARAMGVTALVLLALIVLLGVMPAPASSVATGTLEPRRESPVRSEVDGFVAQVHARAGQRVEAGEVLLTLANPDLEASLRASESDLAASEVALDAALAISPSELLLARTRHAATLSQVELARAQVAALKIRAVIPGVVVIPGGARLDDALGMYLRAGELIALVAGVDDMVVRASIDDHDQPHVFREGSPVGVRMRLRGAAGDEVGGRIDRMAPAASREIRRSSLSTDAGGELTPDPTDPKRGTSLRPLFLVEITPEFVPAGLQPGARARVKFVMPAEPLLSQWWRRLSQYLTERVRR